MPAAAEGMLHLVCTLSVLRTPSVSAIELLGGLRTAKTERHQPFVIPDIKRNSAAVIQFTCLAALWSTQTNSRWQHGASALCPPARLEGLPSPPTGGS